MRRSRAVVSGRVQGVGYRAACAREAEAVGAAGWVRNRRDGTVEVAVEGSADVVDSVLRWLRSGPRGARVEDVAVREEEPLGEHGFTVR